ncbi:MAG: hypothetical protein K2K27_04260 [Muribaculaceae bacterium]|nr:hypothetical protein [Muribaculaceae bacterium]
MQFTRTFHSVGQGAFYSEEIELHPKRIFRMVYDCGSLTLKPSELKKRIKSDFANDLNIDILFISHFDIDHINGVKYLQPKVVILPFLTTEQIQILRVYNKVVENTFNIRFIENPKSLFKDAHIIKVLTDTSEPSNDKPNTEKAISINIDETNIVSLSKEIDSKTQILINDAYPVWEYIPLNPNWDKYIEKFRTKIKEKNLDWDKLMLPNNAGYIKSNIKILKDIYHNLNPKNEHSLVVYSNSVSKTEVDNYFYHNFLFYLYPHYIRHLPFGCLYFGDIRIDNKWKEPFYDFLKKTGRLSKVGTIQIPHHGSYLSNGEKVFSDKFIFHNPILCIISVGNFNHFGHPSLHVVKELHRNSGIVTMVTESVTSVCSYYSYNI